MYQIVCSLLSYGCTIVKMSQSLFTSHSFFVGPKMLHTLPHLSIRERFTLTMANYLFIVGQIYAENFISLLFPHLLICAIKSFCISGYFRSFPKWNVIQLPKILKKEICGCSFGNLINMSNRNSCVAFKVSRWLYASDTKPGRVVYI